MEKFARSVEVALPRIWDIEEEKEGTESETNLREYFIAPTCPLVFSLSFVYSCSLESFEQLAFKTCEHFCQKQQEILVSTFVRSSEKCL
jgi:hypothetical protein